MGRKKKVAQDEQVDDASNALVTPAPKAKAKAAKPKLAPKPAAPAKPTAEDKAAKLAEAKATRDTARAERAVERKAALAEAHAEVRRLVAAESARRRCLCGCGTGTLAFFVPGHDAKLVSRLLNGDEAKAA